MYETYVQLCGYVGYTPTDIKNWEFCPADTKKQIISLLNDLIKQLEIQSKPKSLQRAKLKPILKEYYLSLPYTEEQMKVRNIRHFDCSALPTNDMIDIKDSIQQEFFKRQSNVDFKEEKLGLELIVTQKAQMSLFDHRTTTKNSNLYN